MKNLGLVFATFLLVAAAAFAQMPPGQAVVGKVTAVSKDSITVAPMSGGDPVVVKVGDNTRVFKERQPVKLSEIKVDDTVFTRGQLNGTTMEAVIVGVMTPEMAQRIQQGGGAVMGFGGGGGAGQFKPEDWGKTFIAGQVKTINETTLTIAKPNNQETVNIEVDENTSFKKGRESITLADIKPDDFVFGPGEVKNGMFVAKELRVGGGRMFMGPRPGGAEQKTPGVEDKPSGTNEQKPDGNKPPTPPIN